MNATPLRGALLAAFACTLVGASFTANSVLGDYPYAGGQALRYGLAALLLLPLLRSGGPRPAAALRALTRRQWGRLAALAAIGMVGFNLAVLAAERTAEPAVPGVLVGCAPIVVGVLVPALEGRRPTRAVLCAAGLVAAGAFTVQGWGRTDLAGVLYSVGALGGEVGFAVLAVPVLRPLGPKLLSATVCAVASVESVLLGVLFDGGGFLRMPTASETLALLWQAAVVTVIGFVCWYSGMRRIGAERATLFSGLIPVSAALTAPLAGTGTYGVSQGVGSLLVGLGVALGSGVLRRGRGSGGAAARVEYDARNGGGVVVHRDMAAAGKADEPRPRYRPLGPDALPGHEQAVLAAPGDADGNVRYVVGELHGPARVERLPETGGLAQGDRLRHDRIG
ncbi:Permease of the drug/metabolite transporter (DMT) superfamily [Streptomyces sp. LamerLS-316]|nr:Permease of the drug/metabolite transporter (DMT) superfamily [Streptomyces sp. LamerLS-316]